MIFSQNSNNLSLLELELKQLKAIYTKALSKSDSSVLKELRKKIKVLTTRLTLIEINQTLPQ